MREHEVNLSTVQSTSIPDPSKLAKTFSILPMENFPRLQFTVAEATRSFQIFIVKMSYFGSLHVDGIKVN